MPRRSKNFAMSLVGLIVVSCAFLGVAWYLWSQNRAAEAAQSWPSVSAKLISANAHAVGRSGRKWTVDVQYEFSRDQQSYAGSVFDLGSANRSKSESEAFVAGHLPGSTISVRVDPANPRNSAVNVHPPGGNVIPLVMVGVIGIAWIGFWRSRKQLS